MKIATAEMGEAITKPGSSRRNIHLGDTVDVVQKRDQRTGKLTRGVVKDILTNSPRHPQWHQGTVADWSGGTCSSNHQSDQMTNLRSNVSLNPLE